MVTVDYPNRREWSSIGSAPFGELALDRLEVFALDVVALERADLRAQRFGQRVDRQLAPRGAAVDVAVPGARERRRRHEQMAVALGTSGISSSSARLLSSMCSSCATRIREPWSSAVR
jgi:hypothetical protein